MSFIPIDITAAAAAQVRDIMEHKNIPANYLLRIGVKGGGGCGGAGFFLGFDEPKEQDERYQIQGLEVLIDKRHVLYLLDVVLDFEDRREERGFVFGKRAGQ